MCLFLFFYCVENITSFNILTTQHISYKVGDKKLLEDVSITFETGKLTVIIGANGAGKSTLIKILSNQLQATQGEVFFGAKNSKKQR